MTKMDMIWVATATVLHPKTSGKVTVSQRQIEREVMRLFGTSLTPTMLTHHLVSFVDRMADRSQQRRGGSRNRYLFRTSDGPTPAVDGDYRLYKATDSAYDGWDKTGPTHPETAKIPDAHAPLVSWYLDDYQSASARCSDKNLSEL